MNLRWVGTYARVCAAVIVISSSKRSSAKMIAKWSWVLIKILSKSYMWWCVKTSSLQRMIVKSKNLDHQRASESMPKTSSDQCLWQYLEPQTCFEGRISVFCFFWDRGLSEDFYETFCVDSSSKKSCQIENFPSNQWSPKPPVQSSKMICYLKIMSQNFLNFIHSVNRNMCSYLKKTQKGKNNRDILLVIYNYYPRIKLET